MTQSNPLRQLAFERQIEAALPTASTWLSANAGSGKTRVLTDRVARLLLRGVQPQHILCLTYTKAAASEMQNRLFRRLGEWAMRPDSDLRKDLQSLGEGDTLDPDALRHARRLFARAIETPGGLRIQTIHSFCATLLRRFPLEADVAPNFTELDDRAAHLLRNEIIEEMSDSLAPDLMAAVAKSFSGDDIGQLVQGVVQNRAGFRKPLGPNDHLALFGLAEGEDLARILNETFLGNEPAIMEALLPLLAKSGVTDAKAWERLKPLDFAHPTLATLGVLERVFLTQKGASGATYFAKVDSFPTKALQKALGEMKAQLDALMLRVESARQRRLAVSAAEKTALLHRFASVFLPIYAARKSARGWLDFDDLITRAKDLLTNKSVAEWVLFRLDGGIDHILVDEAQDTSPDQWRVIELLAAEFTSGLGARSGDRTLFVVGDKKQSIYSFQGADVAAFDQKRASFREKFNSVGLQFQTSALEHSFRSAEAILRLVDNTFADRFPEALGGTVTHSVFKTDMPGRVDLWPMVEKITDEENEEWENPIDLISSSHHHARLADQIAAEIKAMIDAGVQIPTDKGNRPVHAGDFLILVQKRSGIFPEIIRACKQAALPIAGADRLKLGGILAVKDLTALLAFLSTPEDDLSLAATLRSPLCGWSEGELYNLAHGRKGYLWEALRAADTQAEGLAMLQDLRDQADFLRPYDLIERALTRHDGRRRLIARLGQEAEDGIDAFLAQALAFERLEVPSLTGFMVWLGAEDVVVKRQMDSEGQLIRVMTVHGAKGLEAPIVILPETSSSRGNDRDEVFFEEGTPPLWRTAEAESPPLTNAIRDMRKLRAEQESLRLLYVALTRARCWLIVAGAGEAKGDNAWYNLVAQGMQAVGAVPHLAGRLRYETGAWPANEPSGHAAEQTFEATLPDWALTPAAAIGRPLRPVSPSDLGGAKVMPGEVDGSSTDDAKARGIAVHLLLETLPNHPKPDWPALAAALLDPKLCAEVLAEVSAILNSETLAPLFGAEGFAEVPISGVLMGQPAFGTVDRLIISTDEVLAIDFKSNHLIPSLATQVPEGVLRQMAAYAAMLAQIYPAKRISTAILWTRTATLMPLDPELLAAALSRSTLQGSPTP